MPSEDWKVLRTITPIADDATDWNDPAISSALADSIIKDVPRKRPDTDVPTQGVQIAVWLFDGGVRIDPATFACTIQFYEIVDGLNPGRGVIHSDEETSVGANSKVVTRDLPGPTKFSVKVTDTANIPVGADQLVVMYREV